MVPRDSVDPDADERDETDPEGVASSSLAGARTPGYDVARALALLGMVLLNFRGILGAYDDGNATLLWLADRLEGKAGALFVLLAGIGISLATHRHAVAYDDMGAQRRALLERAAILLGVGSLLMHVWEWDILHFHGIYLLLAIFLLRARTPTLWLCALGSIWIAVLLDHELDWNAHPSLASASGLLLHVFYNGHYPVFPWIAFVLVGMAVGRLDLSDPRVLARTLAIALAVAFASEVVDTLARWDERTGALGLGPLASALNTWPRGPRPLFVVSGSAYAIALVCICILVTRGRSGRPWVTALVATGQLAFTLYVAHAVAILVPIQHGLVRDQPIELPFAIALLFYALAIAFALWWRRRFTQGPIEGLMRQVTRRDRTRPGPTLR